MIYQKISNSLTFYPVTMVYLGGVGVAMGISSGWIDGGPGLLLLSMLTLIVVLVSMFREVQVVHHLVNSQRTALLERIAELVEAMQEAGVELPPREQEAQQGTEPTQENTQDHE